MSIKISIKKNINDKDIRNYVLFCDENFNTASLKKYDWTDMYFKKDKTL